MSYDPTCSDNLAVYWGQNSGGSQQTLSAYCQDTVIDVFQIAFVNKFFSTGGMPELDLSNASGETSSVLNSDADGVTLANNIWNLFLGGSSSERPFGSAVLDGVDLDIEVGAPTGYAAFVNQIRMLSAGASKHYYVTAAPQCPFPDAHIGGALDAAAFDAVYVQFYNNNCGVINAATSDWNFDQWDTWAKGSLNPNAKVFIGAPASSAAGGGYVNAATLGSIVTATRAQYSSLGGVMLWWAYTSFYFQRATLTSSAFLRDASAAYANARFDQQVKNLIAANGCSAGTNPGGPGGCAQTYTVVSGDTCSHIESTHGISDAQLHTLNPSINSGCTNLSVGQTLCLQASTGSGGTCTSTYTVVSGDTCSHIESTHGISDAQLHALNPAINSGCTNLSIGQKLCLNGGSGGSGCTQYTVVSGDTCSHIESTHGISDAQLHAQNPSINSGCTNLQIGQKLCV
ncbi:glycoside hydrolase superfamily [Mycena vulgaris]|nr:glycoside hydrolase superfamily [Mycena vulgaris]